VGVRVGTGVGAEVGLSVGTTVIEGDVRFVIFVMFVRFVMFVTSVIEPFMAEVLVRFEMASGLDVFFSLLVALVTGVMLVL
jgi:hypothetical protein